MEIPAHFTTHMQSPQTRPMLHVIPDYQVATVARDVGQHLPILWLHATVDHEVPQAACHQQAKRLQMWTPRQKHTGQTSLGLLVTYWLLNALDILTMSTAVL